LYWGNDGRRLLGKQGGAAQHGEQGREGSECLNLHRQVSAYEFSQQMYFLQSAG